MFLVWLLAERTRGNLVKRVSVFLGMLMSMLFVGAGSANPSIGLSINAGEAAAFTASARYDFVEWGQVDRFALGARADVSLAANSGPAYAAAAVLSAKNPDHAELYVGGGAGLDSTGAVAGYAFSGVRYQLWSSLFSSVEYTVAWNHYLSTHGVRVGLDWLFGDFR